MRLPPLTKADMSPEQRELFDALVGKSVGRGERFVLDEHGAVRGPFAPLLRHPASGRPLQEMAAALRFAGGLPDAAREVAICVVGAYWRDAHEFHRHADIARAVGVAEEALANIHDGRAATFTDPVVQAVHDATFAICHRDDLTDDEYAAAHAQLGDELMVELSAVVGYYTLLSMQLRIFRIPGDEPY